MSEGERDLMLTIIINNLIEIRKILHITNLTLGVIAVLLILIATTHVHLF